MENFSEKKIVKKVPSVAVQLTITSVIILNYETVLIYNTMHPKPIAGLGGSVGCAVRLETRRSRVQPPPRSATFFRGD